MEPCYLIILLCITIVVFSFINFKINIDTIFNKFYDQLRIELGKESLRGISSLFFFIAFISFFFHKFFH